MTQPEPNQVQFNIPTSEDFAQEYEFVGFWSRLGASIFDTVLFSIALLFLPWPNIERNIESYSTQTEQMDLSTWSATLTSGDTLWHYLPLLIITVLFWRYRAATPGKMLIGARIVDAKTGNNISTLQSLIRYVAYYLSAFVFMLGFIWIGFDGRKQGWHDKIAGTVVIRIKRNTFKPKG